MANLAFCTSSRNRRFALEQTLHHNLQTLSSCSGAYIALVDYGSSDGTSDFIWENFKNYILDRKLVFFQVTNPTNWSSPKAKNLAHRLGAADYLFNLDADNFISLGDVELIAHSASRRMPCHQFSGDYDDGTFGRIGLTRQSFYKLGGYDEGMLPMGFQDSDLLIRLCLDHGFLIYSIPVSDSFVKPIKNNKHTSMNSFELTESLNAEDARALWNSLNSANVQRSDTRRRLEGNSILGGFSSFIGYLNGHHVAIDGFNNVTIPSGQRADISNILIPDGL